MTNLGDRTSDSSRRQPACSACSKSKRKCNRQSPTCRRCRVQNLRCAYPAMVTRVMLPGSPQLLRQSTADSPLELSASEAVPPSPAPRQAPWEIGPADRAGLVSGKNHVDAPWFLDSSSWEVDFILIGKDDRVMYTDSGLDYFLDKIKVWLDQWASENHCAFFHARLYGSDLPDPLQHALAAWQVYRAAETPTSRRIALRMATAWSQNLIWEASTSDSLPGAGTPGIIDQLARVQALFVFQFIGLFDGDVRARGHSENVLSTLTTWASTLMQTAAAQVTATPERPSDPDALLNEPQITQLQYDGTPVSAWKAWILSESIRRAWLVSALTEAAFLIMRQGLATCPGSIAFTGKSGVWDASSPREWDAGMVRQSCTKTPVYCRGLDRLLDDARASDVDEFTQALLAYGRGREALDDWVSLG